MCTKVDSHFGQQKNKRKFFKFLKVIQAKYQELVKNGRFRHLKHQRYALLAEKFDYFEKVCFYRVSLTECLVSRYERQNFTKLGKCFRLFQNSQNLLLQILLNAFNIRSYKINYEATRAIPNHQTRVGTYRRVRNSFGS